MSIIGKESCSFKAGRTASLKFARLHARTGGAVKSHRGMVALFGLS
jgi:hypothetical protein